MPMKQSTSNKKFLSLLVSLCWIAFFTSFICSFRALSSISIILLLLVYVFINRKQSGKFFLEILKYPLFIACLLFFIVQLTGLLYTHHLTTGWKDIRIKTGLLFIPPAFFHINKLSSTERRKLSVIYIAVLALAALYCLLRAIVDYMHTPNDEIFFYHALVSPFSQHAVYFSIYVFIALALLLETGKNGNCIFHRLADIFLIIYFTAFIFLLASKLVIAFYILYIFYYFIVVLKNSKTSRIITAVLFFSFIATGIAALAIPNPVSRRFYEIAAGDIGFINQDKFDQGDYFNGLQFRLLQWRFTAEILSENHCWLTGVSAGDAQSMLNQKYIDKKMYTGGTDGRGKGFLGYNTHNQFLESLLQSGITGLLAFLFIIFSLAAMAIKSRSRLYRAIILLLIIYSFSESVFETQYGILLYTFFPLFARPAPLKS